MLIIRPIQEAAAHEALGAKCGCGFQADALAYGAFDADESTHEKRFDIGICRLTIHGEAVITALRVADGISDDEALMIMARTAMSFVYRCGFPHIFMAESACTDELTKALGFRKNEDGRWAIDLAEFYKSPCHYNG